jgi:hypothetical protein
VLAIRDAVFVLLDGRVKTTRSRQTAGGHPVVQLPGGFALWKRHTTRRMAHTQACEDTEIAESRAGHSASFYPCTPRCRSRASVLSPRGWAYSQTGSSPDGGQRRGAHRKFQDSPRTITRRGRRRASHRPHSSEVADITGVQRQTATRILEVQSARLISALSQDQHTAARCWRALRHATPDRVYRGPGIRFARARL